MNTTIFQDKKKVLYWFISVVLPLMLFLIPTNEVFTSQIRTYLVLSMMAILVVAFDLMNIIIPSVLLPTCYFAFGIAPASQAFQAYTTTATWMVLGAFALTNALDESGLLPRIAYAIVGKLGGSYNATLYAVYVVGVVLGQITFAGHYLLVIAFTYGICRAMKLKPHSNEGIIMMMVGGLAALNVKLFIYRPATMSIMVAGVQSVVPDFTVPIWAQTVYNAPAILIGLSFIWILTKIYKTKNYSFEGGKQYFVTEYEKLGKFSTREKKAAVIIGLLMAYMVLQPIHGLNMDFGFMILPWLCFIPGIDVGTKASIDKISMGMIFFVAACLGIGQVGVGLGLGDLLVYYITPLLQSFGTIAVSMIFLILASLSNLILTPGAMTSCLPPAIASIYVDLGMNPLTGLLTIIYATDLVFMPHEVPAYLIMFGFGMMSMKDFIKFSVMKCGWFILMFLLIQIPFWALMGLM